ncbi:MAG: TonB-dependent receptor [Ignavibacteria bacterium]|jgi:TonB-dependent receptor
MSKKFTTVLGCILLILQITTVTTYSASKGKIKGTVKDALTNDPLPYANIILVGTSLGTATDPDGNYLIQQIPAGSYTVRATFIGYKSTEVSIEVKEDRTTEYNFTLETESILGDTLIVTAQAEGQKRAINEQITSIPIKNVVSAARIQELPDANAAESVSRLPGVSIIRTGGEGSQIVVRGLSPQYNRITIDGVELPSNVTSSDPISHGVDFEESNKSLSLSGDRATDLSMISSNMLGGIEVIKAITPDMDATVLGGTINFSMRKAVNTKTGAPRFEAITQGGYGNLKDSYNNYKTVASYEQRFFNESFGLFSQVSFEERNLNSNELNAEYTYYGALDVASDDDPEFINMSLDDVLRERRRLGATIVLDYTHESGSVDFMNFFSRSNTDITRRNEFYELENNDIYFSGRYLENTLNVYSNLLSIKQTLADWGVELKLSHSFSGSENPTDVKFNFWNNDAGFSDLSTTLKYASTTEIMEYVARDEENTPFYEIYDIDNISKDRTYNASLDLFSDFSLSRYVTAKIKFGGSFQYRKRSYDYNERSGSVYWDDGAVVNKAIRDAFPEFGDNITFTDFYDEDYSYDDFLKGDYILGSPMDIDLMMDVINVANENITDGKLGGFQVRRAPTILNDYEGHEERGAGYLMANLNLGQIFTLVPGFRYQNLTTVYSGIRAEPIPGDLMHSKVEKTVSHGYFLPMIHFRIKPNDWMQFHFAYTNTLNYPDFNTIIPKWYIGKNFVLYNNYELKPARSENFDVVLSFFSNEIGLFSIGGFKKNVKDLIFPIRIYPSDWSEYPELESELVQGQAYSLVSYRNNPIKIDVYGIETEWQTNFWYLPQPFNGVVLNLNYTHIFSEADYPKTYTKSWYDPVKLEYHVEHIDTTYSARLLNQPNDVFNVSLGYDYADFSLRISMLYQDNIFKRPDFWEQNRVLSSKYVRFDVSAKQKLPWYGLQVYVNLNNIAGEDDIDINKWTSYHTNRQRYGMTADLGLRLSL